ncbi:unnamed protein product [Chironomus riparius]|uniref:Uncharacterized protein n=1 Tax=Chironomus riparius TaxID=315576 RepID=A0A9N9S497_9DIPT|nr:unnamed protein product [Chironomus riparius]
MKIFLVAFVAALMFVNESSAGSMSLSSQRCSAAVLDTRDLSPWILKEMNEKLYSLKGMPMEEIAVIMDKAVEEMMTRDNLTRRDADILQALMADSFEPRGEIIIRIKVWGCYIEIHIRW